MPKSPTEQTRARGRNISRLLLLLVIATKPLVATAQPSVTSLNATAGATVGDISARLLQLDLRRQLAVPVAASAALTYLESDQDYREVQLRLAATATVLLGQWTLEDRNLLMLTSKSVERYRNRARLTFPLVMGKSHLNVHVFDEIFYDFDRDQILRNNIALGFSSAVGACCSIEVYHIWSDERFTRDGHFVFASLTWRIAG